MDKIYIVDIISDGDEQFRAFSEKSDAERNLKERIGEYFLELLKDSKEDSTIIEYIKSIVRDFEHYEDETLKEYMIDGDHYKLMIVPFKGEL